MSNDTTETAPAANEGRLIVQDSPAQLVILAGGDVTLCVGELCVTGDVGAMDPAIAEVTA